MGIMGTKSIIKNLDFNSLPTFFFLFLISSFLISCTNTNPKIESLNLSSSQGKLEIPAVISVSSNSSDSYYKTGSYIYIEVKFSKKVSLNGSFNGIELYLNSGSSILQPAKAVYYSGNNSNTLTFLYTVESNHYSNDLNYESTGALILKGGTTLRDMTSAQDAQLTLPEIGLGQDLASAKNIYIDAIPPAPVTNLIISGGAWSKNTTQTPMINFTNSSDKESGISQHELKLYDSTNGSTLVDYKPVNNGTYFSGLNLIHGHSYNVVVRAVDKAGNTSAESSSTIWTIDTILPTATGAITLSPVPPNYKRATPTFTFANSVDYLSGFAYYKIEIRKSADNSLIKTLSTLGSPNNNGPSGISYTDNSDFLTAGETYYAAIRGVDAAGNEGPSTSSPSWMAFSCPNDSSVGTFIAVPPRSPYTTSAFCVAKYEMKVKDSSSVPFADGNISYDSSYKAESRPVDTPWSNITRDQAIHECQALGSGFDLISNHQWQTIARNLEEQNTNWTNGTRGSEMMYRGHTDSSPNRPLSVDNLSDEFDQLSNNSQSGNGKERRRTLYLSNGAQIWDFSGNIFEWIKDDNNVTYGSNNYWVQVSDSSHPSTNTLGNLTGTVKYLFGPSGNYSSLGSTEDYGNLGYATIDSLSGGFYAMARGGGYWSSYAAGAFNIQTNLNPSSTFSGLGFRCVYTP